MTILKFQSDEMDSRRTWLVIDNDKMTLYEMYHVEEEEEPVIDIHEYTENRPKYSYRYDSEDADYGKICEMLNSEPFKNAKTFRM